MPNWDQLFTQEEFCWKDPHVQVTSLVPLLRARNTRRVLDLGCGAGQHTVYLAREGFEVYGIDLAENGLAHTRRWLEREHLAAELKRADIEEIPYPDGFFDAVICIFVIYHKTLAGMEQVVAEIHRARSLAISARTRVYRTITATSRRSKSYSEISRFVESNWRNKSRKAIDTAIGKCWSRKNSSNKKQIPPGNDLLSQRCVPPVPSALAGLTSGFGMGPGISPPLKSPEESVFSNS